MKGKILRKVLAVSLSAAMIMCAGLTTVGQFVGTDISVSAADTYGDFQYQVNGDGTVTIMEYTGNGGDVAVPSMINGRNVTVIYNGAFHECETLTSVTIPYGITAVNDLAFVNCKSLISIVFSESVTFIGENVFTGCESLESIIVDKNNSTYSSDNGVLLDKDKKTLIFCPRNKKGTYKIPDTVTSVREYAFCGCRGLTSIDIPNGITKIESFTFSECGLTSIVIPNGVTSIGYNAFDGCGALQNITFPASLTKISGRAFKDTAWYNSQPNGLVFAGNVLYKYKGSMPYNTNITVKDGTVSIGAEAFSQCRNMTSVTLPGSVTGIDDNAFSSCSSLKRINMPNNLKYIGISAFSGCTSLSQITLPDSITEIHTNAFYNTGLTSITIPDSLTDIGGYVFGNCTNLISASIPDSITQTGRGVFQDCKKLENVTIGKGLTYIHDDWFAGCTSLKNITLPDNIKSIGWETFSGCTSLQGIVIPDGVTFIGYETFARCTSMTSFNIPDSVTSVNSNAFIGCTNLTSITVPESVTFIGWNAFSDCPNLTIYGMKGSYAETYAKRNNIPFVSAISSDEIVLGGTVTVNAKAVNCTSNYTYAVLYKKKSENKWTVKQNYSTNDTVVIKPARATDYDICVKVKDTNGKIIKKFFELKVNEKLKNTSVISAATIKKGSTVTVKGSATGGMGNYQYAVLYKKKSESKWTVRQGYKDNSEIIVRPYTNTDYDICIKVQDSSGTIAKKYFSVTVK